MDRRQRIKSKKKKKPYKNGGGEIKKERRAYLRGHNYTACDLAKNKLKKYTSCVRN